MTNWFAIIGVTGSLLVLLLVVLSMKHVDAPSDGNRAIAEAEGVVIDQDDGDAVAQPRSTLIVESSLLPLGWIAFVLGAALAGWAWLYMDITPVDYSDTVNMDAISQRSMLNTLGLVTAAIGAVMACAGHVVNEVRRGIRYG